MKNEYHRLFAKLLSRLSINADIKGYHYLVYMCSEIMEYSSSLVVTVQELSLAQLCRMTAEKYQTNERAVNSSITYAVQKIIANSDGELLDKIFGSSLTTRSGTTRVKSMIYGLCNYANNFSDEVMI